MSTLTVQRKDTIPNLDGPNDLQPAPKTSRVIEQEAKKVVVEKKATKETK